MSSTSLLACYNFFQSVSCTLEPKKIMLRPTSHEQIRKAIAPHNHDASIMAALLKKTSGIVLLKDMNTCNQRTVDRVGHSLALQTSFYFVLFIVQMRIY